MLLAHVPASAVTRLKTCVAYCVTRRIKFSEQ
jgi:hypothetical protein